MIKLGNYSAYYCWSLMNEKFNAATRFLIESKGHKLSNEQKLKLYGLYK